MTDEICRILGEQNQKWKFTRSEGSELRFTDPQARPTRNAVIPAAMNKPAITFWRLVAVTFFVVSGGSYGTEEIVRDAGYGFGIAVLALTPIFWSLPTAMMTAELSAALPCEGGYYAWVRRALGNFWGFQEAWLSLTASIFDMAIYPTLFVAYLARLFPSFSMEHHGLFIGLAVIAACALMNVAGIRVVAGTSAWLFALLLMPFAILVALALFKHGALAHGAAISTAPNVGIAGGVLIAMWNYMGWDSASTVAVEVDRPQATYPRAMLATVAIVALSYILPFAAVWLTGIAPSIFDTGAWAEVAGLLGGNWLRVSIVIGGLVSAFAMFNSLVMSYSRLPLAMAQDHMLPSAFARLNRHTRAPWLSITVLAIAWASCLSLGFERLITLDVLLYGSSLVLEFVALAVLRFSAPELRRSFRVPGGFVGAVTLGIIPTLLLGFALVHAADERIFGVNALLVGAAIIAGGFVAYYFSAVSRTLAERAKAAEEMMSDQGRLPVSDNLSDQADK
jgi:amino acid transporter